MVTHIPFAAILSVKTGAKKLKHLRPDLSHMQRLDLATQELFGYRHFRELNTLRSKTINRHLVVDGLSATCTYCGFSFFTDIPEDRNTHTIRHNGYEEAVTSLAYKPMLYAEREAQKKKGYELLNSDSPGKRIEGALYVLRAWFDRSLDNAIDQRFWKKHPSFERYIAMMMAQDSPFPEQVTSSLVDRYGVLANEISRGKTYWYPS